MTDLEKCAWILKINRMNSEPSKDNYYQMMIGAEIRRSRGVECELSDLKLVSAESNDNEQSVNDVEQVTAQMKAFYAARLGHVPKTERWKDDA